MANVLAVQGYGNNMAVLMDDGTRLLAYKSRSNYWIVSQDGTTPPDPSSAFVWPFNPDDVADRSKWQTPERPTHKGWDWSLAGGTPVPVIADGVVVKSFKGPGDYGDGWGYHVRVNHGVFDGATYWSAYCHFQSPPTLNVGDSVSQRDIVGLVGTTGESTGNHLHFEIWRNGVRVDPLPFMTARGAVWPWP